MACKLCGKSLYYETSWQYTDAGYGDTDYGGVNIHQIGVRICPNCGEIKVNKDLDDSAKEKVIMDVLANIIVQNIGLLESIGKKLDEKKLIENVETLLQRSSEKYIKELLNTNNLIFKDSNLSCSCGYHLIKGSTAMESINNLLNSPTKFCGGCGRKFVRLKNKIESEVQPIDFLVETRKTWDRSE